MTANRQFGLLLHPTSLPGNYGTGDIGPSADDFISILHAMGASLWQILPLNNPGRGYSPYSADSVFAGNPLLISPDRMHQQGWLSANDLEGMTTSSENCDFERAATLKYSLFHKAFYNFFSAGEHLSGSYQDFMKQNAFWLNDYAVYKAIKNHHGQKSWLEWPVHLKNRDSEQMKVFKKAHADDIRFQIFLQYLFFTQWSELKRLTNSHNIRIIGDLPIFPALDSADVWSNHTLFDLDASRYPRSQAGVPPDYFSPTGQKWGNPLYDWSENKRTDYTWWKNRFRMLLRLVDVIRIDHFRGFETYWAIPSGAETAETGEWKPGPGAMFFTDIKNDLGHLPVIAEDLGIITSEVKALRDYFGFPGMTVLQFAFDGIVSNPHLMFNHRPNDVVFTGTHDNNTTQGWWDQMDADQRHATSQQMESVQGHPVRNIVGDLLRMAMSSVCHIAVIPVQDILGLAASARLNTPGTAEGNWKWRLTNVDDLAQKTGEIRDLALTFNRIRQVD
jgi:4-alpha-glucanotransferase